MARLVYSTGPDGRVGSGSGSRRRRGTEPGRSDHSLAAQPPLRVRRERSGRRGKTVTTAGPFRLPREEARALLSVLKRRCGSGGTVKRPPEVEAQGCFRLEIQGDHVERLTDELARLGYEVARRRGE